jgi:hypothetical protein
MSRRESRVIESRGDVVWSRTRIKIEKNRSRKIRKYHYITTSTTNRQRGGRVEE